MGEKVEMEKKNKRNTCESRAAAAAAAATEMCSRMRICINVVMQYAIDMIYNEMEENLQDGSLDGVCCLDDA